MMKADYSGVVDACNVRLWTIDVDGTWLEGGTTDELDALTPGGASAVDEGRIWEIGEGVGFTLQVASVSGGGSVQLSVTAIEK